MVVACGVTKNQFVPQHVALTLGQKAPTAYLWVAYILQLDGEQRYLAVAKSDFTVSLTADRERVLFHYDYAREPSNEYPAAHVQVAGESKDWATLTEARGQTGKPLKDFHFPVGGRRYRPILEDVIEFLVLENLADARPDWRDVIQVTRDAWEEKQLRAAVRRNPDAALRQLREDGMIE
jgi:hypothetical protein